MFRHILLPVDLTDKNLTAVDIARGFLGETGGEVTLLHVIETITDAPFEDLEDFYHRLEEKARVGMNRLAEPLTTAGIEVEQSVVYGRRSSEIVAFALEKSVDLILLSSHPLDPESPETAWGSISHQVAVLARCPVLLLK